MVRQLLSLGEPSRTRTRSVPWAALGALGPDIYSMGRGGKAEAPSPGGGEGQGMGDGEQGSKSKMLRTQLTWKNPLGGMVGVVTVDPTWQ